MTTKTQIPEGTITVRQFVQREVLHNISNLINELAKDEKYSEELLAVCVQDDWETPAFENGYLRNTKGQLIRPSYQLYCEDNNIDPYQNEALEHWLITDWLAEKLEAKGEMILRDFMNLTLWGRACSGQAIMLDSVIGEIYTDLTGFKPEF